MRGRTGAISAKGAAREDQRPAADLAIPYRHFEMAANLLIGRGPDSAEISELRLRSFAIQSEFDSAIRKINKRDTWPNLKQLNTRNGKRVRGKIKPCAAPKWNGLQNLRRRVSARLDWRLTTASCGAVLAFGKRKRRCTIGSQI